MRQRDPMVQSSERRAALLSIHHHSGRIVVPTFLMPPPLRLMPLKQSVTLIRSAADALENGPANDLEAAGTPRLLSKAGLHSATRALVRGFADADERRAPYLQRACQIAGIEAKRWIRPIPSVDSDEPFEFPAELERGLTPKRPDLPKMKPRTCICCRNAAADLGLTIDEFPIVVHDHAAWVDLDSSVSWVVIRLKVREAATLNWFDVFARFADPKNWKDTAEEFFQGSKVIDELKQLDGIDGWRGSFHEIVNWTWNESVSSTFKNVLQIDFQLRKDYPAARLMYRLVETEFSRIAGSLEEGGLDVDDGYMLAYHDEADKSVLVEVLKKIRFTDRESPSMPGGLNFGQLLNFTAPSMVGLWLDALVYEGALFALRNSMRRSISEIPTAVRRKGGIISEADTSQP